MKVLDLFSGIGGFSLGLERAGMETVAFCEIDQYCQKVLRKHWPKVPIYGDIRELTGEKLKKDGIKKIDIVCGGFPCQDISYAGKGAGIVGERSGLWRELMRTIRLVRPSYAIVENVAALLKRGMGSVLGDLAKSGYDAEWDCVSASAVGAIHKRERVFLIAYNSCDRRERLMPQQIHRQPAFSWLKNVRGIEDLRKRSSIYTPTLCRDDDGIPHRVDRLRALGNAIVPQIAEEIGRLLLTVERS